MAFFSFTRSKDPSGILNELLSDILAQLYTLGYYSIDSTNITPIKISKNVLKLVSIIQSPSNGAFPFEFEGTFTQIDNNRVDVAASIWVPPKIQGTIFTDIQTAMVQQFLMYEDINAIYVDPLPLNADINILRASVNSMQWAGELRINIIGTEANAFINGGPSGTFLGLDSLLIVLGLDTGIALDITQ